MIGSDAALFTCSSSGSAIEQAASILDIPVLKPSEAMFEAAIPQGRTHGDALHVPTGTRWHGIGFREEAARRSFRRD
ncbi:hypothetical protein [Sinorhizobium psoraleae]|uniref:Uncharacterized protein n=1 Tax=Sinorhizobium psoraleae TaxID=520838 RepID=A0ABT4KAF5_9HYPH|nr:hypothetical protein [Sinorhizobium psoraleae]MCZ4088828.1 hypothetical protein [Sinorhizobium psoraleae]